WGLTTAKSAGSLNGSAASPNKKDSWECRRTNDECRKNAEGRMSKKLFPVDGCENQVELFCFLPQQSSIGRFPSSAAAIIRSQYFVSHASFLQMPILQRNSFFDTASSASQ